MAKKHVFFVGFLLVLMGVLGWFIYQQEHILQNGETVILKTRPVDPRDLFRGEYVILRYDIERDEKVLAAAEVAPENSDVYVELLHGLDGIAEVKNVQLEQPSDWSGLWIVGTDTGRGVRFPDLEQFYVQEGAGTPIENLPGELYVDVSLLNGKARVVGLRGDDLKSIDPVDLIE